ncbi:myotubularin-related protein 9-like isoform X1 [Corvus hawaiiensis]|uniref:myotubularin-related protein 9-like isoform X1 n=1 Tax=Corvus hawaiiensis TaxID=134902 RepID=UPI0020197D71|nr:myotubularin-related protein 9-like isoform X1 [Corvus hawaiiensis]XP_048182674.1 myotubularin-related protein 9-like isoform X1 [Corvus hawaiiensis]
MEFSELIKTATVENVLLSRSGLPAVRGTLCITSHHLLLSSCPRGDVELWLLIRNVDAVEKRVQNLGWYQPPRTGGSLRDTRVSGSSGTITLRCKDLKVLQLEIPGMEECLNIASSIEALSSVDSVMMMYPFFYRPPSLRLEQGWQLFPLERYFQRVASQTSQWRLSTVNRDFSTCPSYPPAVIVPAAVGDDTVTKAARFRQGGRFPVLSYFHPKNGTALLRSSQPLTGPNRRRCREDEKLLGTILDEGERGFIIDTRSAQAAKQARMSGGGTEPKSSYPQWRRLHRALDRGRALQESFIRLVEACSDPSLSMDRWLSRLESSRWLGHVKAALSTACLAAQCLDREDSSVLVHGAEGTDTTLLVTALAQLILDPSCRTLEGFQGLLEREWIEAGHPFQLRCARSASSHARGKQEAPLFLLFLDCVWQLSRQFPFSLEFGEQLLLTLFDNAYASAYGTFLCNNEKERSLCKVKESTHSLWAWLNQPEEKQQFLNPLYSHNPLVIWPSVEPQSIQLWQGLFLRWIRPSQHLDEAWVEIQRLVEGNIKESTGKRLSQPLPDPTAGTENDR